MATSDNFQQAVKENRMVSVQEATIRKAVGFTIFGLTTLRLSLKVYGLLSFFLLLARCRTIEQSFIDALASFVWYRKLSRACRALQACRALRCLSCMQWR